MDTATYLFCRKCNQRWALLRNISIQQLYAQAHEFLRSHSPNNECNITHINIQTLKVIEE